jgi:hypothetical protein
MASLRVGYDLFAGSSQAGIDASISGVIQVETAKALKYKLKIKRLSDDKYWDTSTPGWETSEPAEADELDFVGSEVLTGQAPSALRRLQMRIPQTILEGIDSSGAIFTVYATGDTPATAGVAVTLAYQLVT